ncbi:MAG: response regulator transcription factor [Bacillota bacterium]|nr:response regulator transcription factor [Bacillota bacterium]
MERKLKILVIEDDPYISNFISVSLKKDGHTALIADTAAAGLFLFTSHHPDMILLDLGLPDRDGLDVIHELRKFSDIPILVVSARGQINEKIEALDLGANDYITKPFHMGELMARVRVAERNQAKSSKEPDETVYVCDYLQVDYEKRKVTIGDEEVHLTPIEYKLLVLLIQNRGKVLTHNFIMKQIWGYVSSDTKSLRVFMANLRRKIERNTANPQFILTEVGVGYRFIDK